MRVSVQAEPFDPGAELNQFSDLNGRAGAVVSFSGLVRGDDLDALELEHYPGMTEKALSDIQTQAHDRWNLIDSLIIHRYGRLSLGEPIMMVATASPHRSDAFQAAEFMMDYLKSKAPFWKKELRGDHGAWVDARQADAEALKRWSS
ncbi:MAG: molybdenum cofactor biosynthesis protein MoaE [Pseudomonadota bacterium]